MKDEVKALERFFHPSSFILAFSGDVELLKHAHEIEVVPGFDDLSVLDSHDGDSCELYGLVRRAQAQPFALMCAEDTAAGGDLIAFGDRVLDDHLYVGKGVAEFLEEGLEARRPAKGSAAFVRQAVGDALFGKQLIDGLFASLIPDLFNPAMYQSPVFFRHIHLLSSLDGIIGPHPSLQRLRRRQVSATQYLHMM